MKIIVTGATGFVGHHLVKSLLDEGHELVCLVRKVKGIQSNERLTLIEFDLSRDERFELLPTQVDAVVHLAQANVRFPEAADELFAVNSTSTQRLAAYGRRAGASHFVYASSGSVYQRSTEPRKETDSVCPADFYSFTKSCSEDMLGYYRQYFNICILRLFAPYGPGQKARMIPNIVRSVDEGRPVTLVNGGQPLINPIYIEDLLTVLKQALLLSDHHVVNVAGPETVSVKDVASIAGELLSTRPQFEHQTRSEAWNALADTSRMRELFQLDELCAVREGLRQLLAADALEAASVNSSF